MVDKGATNQLHVVQFTEDTMKMAHFGHAVQTWLAEIALVIAI
jgi:hypothetical protein